MRVLVLVWVLIGQAAVALQGQVQLLCQLPGCAEELKIYTFEGVAFRELDRAEVGENGIASFRLPSSAARFYYLGTSPQQARLFLAGEEPRLIIAGNCDDLPNATIRSSELNKAYSYLQAQIRDQRLEAGRITALFARASDPEEKERYRQDLQKLDARQLALIDSMQAIHPVLREVAALNTYLSYPNNQEGYDSELDYFARSFFRFAHLADTALVNHLPWVHDAFANYVSTLSSVPVYPEVLAGYIDSVLMRIPHPSTGHAMALSGVMGTLSQKKHALFVRYAKMFTELYADRYPQASVDLTRRVADAQKLMIGSVAPDFAQPDKDGTMIRLSDLRGQYVLVDFWASWCGPCLMENPNLVYNYHKYKEKGFTILGVSLDTSRDRWLQKIEEQGLEWTQVSDLKYWNNEAARLYEVSGIPANFLLDPEGRIVAKNLRGGALERKLQELFQDEK